MEGNPRLHLLRLQGYKELKSRRFFFFFFSCFSPFFQLFFFSISVEPRSFRYQFHFFSFLSFCCCFFFVFCLFVCLLLLWFFLFWFLVFFCCCTSQQHASVSIGQICSDDCMGCHTEIGVADQTFYLTQSQYTDTYQTFYLTQSQYTDTGPTSLSPDPITPGSWQGSHCRANLKSPVRLDQQKTLGESGNRTPGLPLSRRTP